jgi:hypothetical protein
MALEREEELRQYIREKLVPKSFSYPVDLSGITQRLVKNAERELKKNLDLDCYFYFRKIFKILAYFSTRLPTEFGQEIALHHIHSLKFDIHHDMHKTLLKLNEPGPEPAYEDVMRETVRGTADLLIRKMPRKRRRSFSQQELFFVKSATLDALCKVMKV